MSSWHVQLSQPVVTYVQASVITFLSRSVIGRGVAIHVLLLHPRRPYLAVREDICWEVVATLVSSLSLAFPFTIYAHFRMCFTLMEWRFSL